MGMPACEECGYNFSADEWRIIISQALELEEEDDDDEDDGNHPWFHPDDTIRICCDLPAERCVCGEKTLTLKEATEYLPSDPDVPYELPEHPEQQWSCADCVHYWQSTCAPLRSWLRKYLETGGQLPESLLVCDDFYNEDYAEMENT